MGKFVRENDEVEFISWMLKRGVSKGTIGSRRSGLRHFARWYYHSRGRVLTTGDLTNKDLDAYEMHLWGTRKPIRERHLLAGGTINSYLSAAKAFLEWAKEKTTRR
ncbi:MAG: phage integrase N-terminal SAM-like domain-containing protein [Chloroflexi bacterium]|nr:phage integrase N-terminal SAM-like domain-containing protein [Chloroflexota bacterium]